MMTKNTVRGILALVGLIILVFSSMGLSFLWLAKGAIPLHWLYINMGGFAMGFACFILATDT